MRSINALRDNDLVVIDDYLEDWEKEIIPEIEKMIKYIPQKEPASIDRNSAVFYIGVNRQVKLIRYGDSINLKGYKHTGKRPKLALLLEGTNITNQLKYMMHPIEGTIQYIKEPNKIKRFHDIEE